MRECEWEARLEPTDPCFQLTYTDWEALGGYQVGLWMHRETQLIFAVHYDPGCGEMVARVIQLRADDDLPEPWRIKWLGREAIRIAQCVRLGIEYLSRPPIAEPDDYPFHDNRQYRLL